MDPYLVTMLLTCTALQLPLPVHVSAILALTCVSFLFCNWPPLYWPTAARSFAGDQEGNFNDCGLLWRMPV